MILTKDGVEFSRIAPGGFRILAAIETVSNRLGITVTITSGSDGMHSGLADPHHRGEAYDVRSHDMDQKTKETFLEGVLTLLGESQFFGFVESPDTENEHFHFQVKKGTTYPPAPATAEGAD